MAFATIQYQSRSLQKASAFNVIFPEDAKLPRPWSTFYLLHGLSDDHTIWQRRTSIERYVADLPLVVVMPDGGRGWYSNAVEGSAYEDDLLKDVVGLVELTFPVKAERSGRGDRRVVDGGLWRGEAGAQIPRDVLLGQLALGSVGVSQGPTLRTRSGRSSTLNLCESSEKPPKTAPDDPYGIIAKMDHGRIPALRIDCGTDDFLLAQNRAFHRAPRIHEGRARIPGVPWEPQLGLLGPSCSTGHRVPQEKPKVGLRMVSEGDRKWQIANRKSQSTLPHPFAICHLRSLGNSSRHLKVNPIDVRSRGSRAVLRELSVQNLALIEDARIDLRSGYCSWTGETGAGKSLLLTALGLVLGGKASSDLVRAGRDEARAAVAIDLGDPVLRLDLEAILGGSIDDDHLILTRRVAASGRTSAHANGMPVPIATLQALGERLIDIHGQHESRALLDPDRQRDLLDTFGGVGTDLARV